MEDFLPRLKKGKNPMKRFMAIATLLIIFSANAFQLTQEEKTSDLNQLVSTIKSGYGPLKYKKEILGIDVEKLQKKYKKLIKKTKSNSDFYYLLVQFVAEFHDGHFSARLPTDYGAHLNFTVNWVNGKVLINSINRSKLPQEKFPFEKGDEIIAVDGVETSKVLDHFTKFVGNGYHQTERAIAAYRIVNRPGNTVPVPSGKISLSIRRGSSALIERVELDWETYGTPLDEHESFGALEKEFTQEMNLDLLSIKSMFNPKLDPGFHCSGGTRIAIPKEATIIMKEPFVAYYHSTEKGNVGYLRIPHYSPRDQNGKPDFQLRFAQYRFAVDVLEKNTVGLIIDQDHNCGGSVSYLNQLVSLFMGQPYRPMQFTLLANKTEYLRYSNWLRTANPFTHDYQEAQRVADLIYNAWKAGDFMTPMTAIGGEELLFPNPVHYTKPILMLIDFWSGSGGDAFPSLMQGYGRAKLFGTRTMGLGGHIQSQPALNYSGIKIGMTKSLFYRPDGVAVENNGATPDIDYTITRDDFIYSFKNYQQAYLKELLKMLP